MVTSDQLIPRMISNQFGRAFRIAGVVLIEGPRASGKSTVLSMLRHGGMVRSVVDLTDPDTRRAAANDPFGFVEALTPPFAIDEVQLVPDLILAVKRSVDRDSGWGPAVLTGSSPVGRGQLGGSDPLVGRAVRLRLRPLSRREMSGRTDGLLDAIGDPAFTAFDRGVLDRAGYLDAMVRTGFPAVRDLPSTDVATWFRNAYVAGVLPRALDDENRRVNPRIVNQMLRALSASPGAELNVSGLARTLELSRHTVTSHVGLLGDLGLIDTVPGWRPGAAKRHVSRPKIHPIDGALSAWAIGRQPTDAEIGGLTEAMVYRELAAQVDASFGAVELFHWRHDRNECDLVLAFGDELVPIEVKASRSVPGRALRGIDAFAEAFPKQFLRGLVFYTGNEVVPLGTRRLAVPISALWTTPKPT